MADLTWTMNCILFGAEIMDLIKHSTKAKAINEIKNLSSELDDTVADYLYMRLQELK